MHPSDGLYALAVPRVKRGSVPSMKNLAIIPEPLARLGSTSVEKMIVLCTKFNYYSRCVYLIKCELMLKNNNLEEPQNYSIKYWQIPTHL